MWIELAVAALLAPLLALLHGCGPVATSHLFNISDKAMERKALSPRTMFVAGLIGCVLFALHAAEIWIVAAVYLLVGASRTLPDALFISASSYTTTGGGADRLPESWKLLGEGEALLGLLLVGWSTAYLVRKIDRLRRPVEDDQPR